MQLTYILLLVLTTCAFSKTAKRRDKDHALSTLLNVDEDHTGALSKINTASSTSEKHADGAVVKRKLKPHTLSPITLAIQEVFQNVTIDSIRTNPLIDLKPLKDLVKCETYSETTVCYLRSTTNDEAFDIDKILRQYLNPLSKEEQQKAAKAHFQQTTLPRDHIMFTTISHASKRNYSVYRDGIQRFPLDPSERSMEGIKWKWTYNIVHVTSYRVNQQIIIVAEWQPATKTKKESHLE